ncbi:MAG: hypothetical protein ACQEWU_17295 [Bacillota bacterium]|uniref:hypothetical protein n=1 Tax=Virgibacillus salarius TaxID=447199 RepID=UPI0004169133|nr:hypothetical protein [Priestia megaterium]
MKYFSVILILLFLMGCGDQAETGDDSSNHSSMNKETTANTAVSFRNIDIKVEDGKAIMEGEVNARNTEVFYILEHQNQEIISEKQANTKQQSVAWMDFTLEVSLPEEVMTGKEPPILILYGKNEQDERINANYFPVDINNE